MEFEEFGVYFYEEQSTKFVNQIDFKYKSFNQEIDPLNEKEQYVDCKSPL